MDGDDANSTATQAVRWNKQAFQQRSAALYPPVVGVDQAIPRDERERRARPGLRAVLAGAFGGLGLLAALASSLAVGKAADRRIRADIGAEFSAAAERAADLLDRGLFERLRDVQVAATSLTLMAGSHQTLVSRRALLHRFQETYPDYAILFLIGPDGRVIATSSGAFEGGDVSHREYFQRALKGPIVADLHDALLMAPCLGRGPENPPRFVDLAAPVYAADGTLTGVVAAHLFWEWAEGIERDVMQPVLARHPGAEALVLSRDGRVLLGPPGLRGASLADLAPGAVHDLTAAQSGSTVGKAVSADGVLGRTYLVGYAATHGHRSYAGLGWQVLVRDDAQAAFAPARRLAWEVLAWGVIAAALVAILGWLLAGLIARPLVELCQATARLKGDPGLADVPTGRGPREVASLASTLAELLSAVRQRETALRDGEARLRFATEGVGIGAWELDLGTGSIIPSPRYSAIFGYAEPLKSWGFNAFLSHVVPGDRSMVRRVYQHAQVDAGELQVECRIHRSDDHEERWIEIRGAPLLDPTSGAVARYSGVVTDITDRKAGERVLELLVRELDHRVKNQFAVFDGLVQFTARTSPNAPTMARALRSRVQALAAAHDLVRDAAGTKPDRGLHPTNLATLFAAILGGLGNSAPDTGRIRFDGPELEAGPIAAAALALVLHELATNAAKHGALSSAEGAVEISWSIMQDSDEVRFVWRESGGPQITGEPRRRGFGTMLVRQSIEGQLGGTATFDWSSSMGVLVILQVPTGRLAR